MINAFKSLKILTFHIFYGKIKKVISVKKNLNIKIFKSTLGKKFVYNIFRINNGILYSGKVNDCAIISENKLINEASYQYRFKKKNWIINGASSENITLKIGTPSIRRKISGSVFSLLSGGGGKHNYFHWLFDVLPRLAILENTKNLKRPDYYLAPSLKNAYQHQTLNKLNIPNSKLLDGKTIKHLSCDKLFVTDHPYVFNNDPSKSILHIPDWIIHWLRIKFKTSNKLKKKYPKKIFIDRADSSFNNSRYIINNRDVKSSLEKIGFKVIVLSDFTFDEQIRVFQNAKVIVGLHGAGFANIIFCKARTKVIELQSLSSGNLYKNLAQKCNINYKKISVRSKNKKFILGQGNIFIDINKLKKKILSK